MSTYFVADVGRVTASGFSDMAAHRQEMDAFYNLYSGTAADPGYDPAREPEQMLLRPLFFTGFLIDDFFDDNGFFGAKRVVVSSASSKTSIALAFQLCQRGRERSEVVGLTSKRNLAFVEGLGIHHRVVAYTDIESLDASMSTVFVDMAGDADVTTRIHRHYGSALKYSCQVGGTHCDRLAFGIKVPGPTPTLFWAPRVDLESMKSMLSRTGTRLGYQVELIETEDGRTVQKWIEPGGQVVGVFFVVASAMLGSVVFSQSGDHLPARRTIILPGGRARLVEYKLNHDPRLRSVLQESWRLIKFRHLRRLADVMSLNRENLDQLLDLDPLANRDPQLPLL